MLVNAALSDCFRGLRDETERLEHLQGDETGTCVGGWSNQEWFDLVWSSEIVVPLPQIYRDVMARQWALMADFGYHSQDEASEALIDLWAVMTQSELCELEPAKGGCGGDQFTPEEAVEAVKIAFSQYATTLDGEIYLRATDIVNLCAAPLPRS